MVLINCSLKLHRKPNINNSFDAALYYQSCFLVFVALGQQVKIYLGWKKWTETRTYFDSSRAELQTTTCLFPRELISSLAARVRHESLQSVAVVTPTSVNTSGSWPLLCCRRARRHISHHLLKNISGTLAILPPFHVVERYNGGVSTLTLQGRRLSKMPAISVEKRQFHFGEGFA